MGRMYGVIDTFFHFPFWFFALFLSVIIIIKILTGERIEKISKIGSVFFFVIILPPIIDLILNKGLSEPYSYGSGTAGELLNSFLSFASGLSGIGGGIKVEAIIILLLSVCYIFYKTRNALKALGGFLAIYTIIFMLGIFPTIVFTAQNFVLGNEQEISRQEVIRFYASDEVSKTIIGERASIIDKNNFESGKNQDLKNQFSATFAIIFLIINVLLLGWWYFLYDKEKFFVTIKNFRFLRALHYYLMIFLGIFLGIQFAQRIPIGALFDLLLFASLFFGFLFAGLFSAWENDEVDIEIDKITNKSRPLVKEVVPIGEWRNIKYLFLFLSLNFAFLAGFYNFIFIILFLAIYHIYSAPPLRLKRFLGISSLLVASNFVLAVFMGFFMSAGTENLRDFPAVYLLGIFAIFFLAENVKNIKDIDGDGKEKIKTLPVLLGKQNAKLIVGALVFLSVLLVPVIFFLNIYTFLVAILFGSILFFMINRKKFSKEYAFIFIFITVFIFGVLFAGIFIGNTKTEAIQSAKNGWSWLYSYEGNFLDPGNLFIIKSINDKLCESSHVENFWRERLGEFKDRYFQSVYLKFFDKDPSAKIKERALEIINTDFKDGYFDKGMVQALYCDLYPVEDDFADNLIEGIKNAERYDLTHKFWMAIVLKENGCATDEINIDRAISLGAEKIAKEQEASKVFNDLYAERTAFLLYFGFEDMVKKEWIKNILENQKTSGAWASPIAGLGIDNENPHTTALAVWALSEYSQTCPF